MSLYNFQCEYCNGTVRERLLDREPINHHRGVVILEHVPIGVCDNCGAHYFASPVLKQAETILKDATAPRRLMQVPVAEFRAPAA